jgi:hypothetical protein
MPVHPSTHKSLTFFTCLHSLVILSLVKDQDTVYKKQMRKFRPKGLCHILNVTELVGLLNRQKKDLISRAKPMALSPVAHHLFCSSSKMPRKPRTWHLFPKIMVGQGPNVELNC